MGKIFDYDGVPVLHTTSGDLKGYFYDGVYIYKGIPYAYADRFQMPVPSKWDGVKDATNYGFVCPLQNQDTPNGELMVPHRYWPQDEHCQSLNIWTNKLDPEAKKPVLVWFHGGGYAAGSSIEQVAYDGVSIAKKGDSILVSVNHRLNILGYLDLSPFGEKYKNSANAGHADMVAALQWVHDNIALFGGDPENVTIFGQSGGGMKVIDLMQIPSADGLFQKGLVMSGVMEDDPLGAGEKDGTEIITAMMKALGFDDVAQLETVPYPQLAAAYAKVAPAIAQSGGYIGGGLLRGGAPEQGAVPVERPAASALGTQGLHLLCQRAARAPLAGAVLIGTAVSGAYPVGTQPEIEGHVPAPGHGTPRGHDVFKGKASAAGF